MSAQQKTGHASASCPPEVPALVERFGLHLDACQSGQYNETRLRREFLDPFFKALGWDVENKQTAKHKIAETH